MPYRLRFHFENGDAFRSAFERNLAMGGAFVPTGDPLLLGTIVELEVAFGDRPDRIRLETQVVHVVPLERALRPVEAGVIVSFVTPVQTLREKLAPYLGDAGRRAEGDWGGSAGAAGPTPPPAAPREQPAATSFYPPDTHFQPRVLHIESARLSPLEASLIELATVGLPTSRMLEVIPEEESAIQEGLRTLVEQGVLQVV